MRKASVPTPVSQLLESSSFINLSAPELIECALRNQEGILANNGALAVTTGKYTGRSPEDRFFVKDEWTSETIDWSRNQHINESVFLSLLKKMTQYLNHLHEKYVFRGFAGADARYRLSIQVVNEYAWQNLFCSQLFIKPTKQELMHHQPEFTILSAPGFKANPSFDGTRSEAFIIISLHHRIVLIGGTAYAGEIKKSVFTILNFLLPQKGVMPMHCSANVDQNRRTALFFGLSGTGKTTLSHAHGRQLIGDDEHGWSEDGVFNFEGGCYAKTIRLTRKDEPQIYNSIGFGAILENVAISNETRVPDYIDARTTENTRAAYSLAYVANARIPSIGTHPDTIIFLTADACGVLPPISLLTPEQAIYHFLSGYTSKLSGTERGIIKPEATFSTCFGAPFMPLSALTYAKLLNKRIKQENVNVFLINTGWIGGPYGVGSRINLAYTRAMVTAALNDRFDRSTQFTDPIFGLHLPLSCPDVPGNILLPWQSWHDRAAYECAARQLAKHFQNNFRQFKDAPTEWINAGPLI
ncbi:phosphoenolpyruvate carboxykinase (ATP) [Sporolactobacillus sp. CPB3-1]|uniref:Phosphoenolpyruvate carboxykinase (ATP) n=1 Tax=Sporolactobacillus mangiferae TaxID=2940498 RepID=A0ABT0M726_9BACL|nr:phosphoenolpyruvate carboxykinase (ATP) [Sporolactobacillus mangiferae]MCL1630662.1 phosphoenolpyruvate carboxykinase (ATP) [Sporolactobacillus mangiferae]